MTNPNRANQYNTDPRQTSFIAYYLDPNSDTYSNCLQSALKAGYEREYAENLLNIMPKWLSESLDVSGDMKRLRKAEKNLDEVQNMIVIGEDGRVDTNLLDKRLKVDFFYAERLNKNKYSVRKEMTGAGGERLIPLNPEQQEAVTKALEDLN
jgi:hypothetical protein